MALSETIIMYVPAFHEHIMAEEELYHFYLGVNIQCSIGDIRDTVVARWTAGQQVEQSILHQGHDS